MLSPIFKMNTKNNSKMGKFIGSNMMRQKKDKKCSDNIGKEIQPVFIFCPFILELTHTFSIWELG